MLQLPRMTGGVRAGCSRLEHWSSPATRTARRQGRSAAHTAVLALTWFFAAASSLILGQTAAPKPQPQSGSQAQLEAATKEALAQYSAALESLDATQVKKIHPSVDVEGLKRAFRDMRELKVAIDDVRVLSTEGAVARVSCRVTQTLTPKAGAKQTSAVTRVLRLRRQEAVWLIDGFER